jgi:chromosome segregation ATPase
MSRTHTRRFDIIVAPEDYARALGLYERHKAGYPLPGRGEVFISGVGLVDIERILPFAPRPAPRSLAEQIETDDPYARAYCNFILGDIMCVDDEQSLRKHKAAITDSVMVYRNHVARQTPKEVYSRHYIGQAALRRRAEEIAERLGVLHQSIVEAAEVQTWLKAAVALLDRARAEARRLPDLMERASGLAVLKVRVQKLREQKDRIHRDDIRELERSRDELKALEETLDRRRDDLADRCGQAKKEIEHLTADREGSHIRQRQTENVLQEFAARLDEAAREKYEQRYARERQHRVPSEIHEVFERQRRAIETRVEAWIQKLVRLKTQYVERRGLVAPVEALHLKSSAPSWNCGGIAGFRNIGSEFPRARRKRSNS